MVIMKNIRRLHIEFDAKSRAWFERKYSQAWSLGIFESQAWSADRYVSSFFNGTNADYAKMRVFYQ